MSNSTSKASATEQTKDSAATPEAVIYLRGHRDAIDAHAAHQQTSAPDAAPLRTDRNYRAAYTGPTPGEKVGAKWIGGLKGKRYRTTDLLIEHLRDPTANTGENVFLYVMFSGIYTLHRINGLWKNTIGRFTDKLWVYPVGGEF